MRRPPRPDPAPSRPDPRPGTVTEVAVQARDKERVNVAVDGAHAFSLALEVAEREGVAPGLVLDRDRIDALLAVDSAARATAAALAFLGYRPRTEREVRDRLRERGHAPAAVEATIERLRGWRYVDDAGFARFWVEGRVEHRPRGRRLLEQELRQKGVDRETAREAVADADYDEVAAAVALARKRWPAYAADDPASARRRLGAYLQRRGFGRDAVRAALRDVLREDADDLEPDEPGPGDP